MKLNESQIIAHQTTNQEPMSEYETRTSPFHLAFLPPCDGLGWAQPLELTNAAIGPV